MPNLAGGLHYHNGSDFHELPLPKSSLKHEYDWNCVMDADQIEAFLMPIADEFRGYLEGIKDQISTLREDIARKDEKDDEQIRFLRDLIMGNGQFQGMDSRLRSVEHDRDETKKKIDIDRVEADRKSDRLWTAVISLSVGVLVALIPIIWEIIKYTARSH